MPEPAKTSFAAVGVTIGLGVLALLFWLVALATLSDLAGSDAAGNGYAQAFAAIEIVVLWSLLALIALIAGVKGAMAWPSAIAATILIPASAVISFEVLGLLSRPHLPPFLWPLVIPAAVPPLVLAFSLWALIPPLHTIIGPRLAGGFVWGLVLLLCLAIVPLQRIRNEADDRIAAALEKYNADLAKLPADAPLWDWVPFLDTRNSTRQSELLAHISTLERRQGDAELMLGRGDFPLGFLGRLDLTPTPAICDKARALLRRQVAPLVLQTPNSKPYSEIFWPVANALAAMKWLVGHDCSCDAESLAWETMASAYRDTNFDLVELRQLRDKKNLGRQVREYPERFSMLTPKAHLKAWLSFADKDEFHDQALAGARTLDHRTGDAVEMLTDKLDMAAPWQVLKYMPALDLEMTAPLCRAALDQIDGDIAKVYRPKADDPRPYSELLQRLGAYEPLTALAWAAGHGCEAEPELSEAEELIRTYQDSPARAAMLARLDKLHRK
ncbi:MAG TPA: hypothetical protein VFW22_04125 [Pseudolabrys sp.]|nr:hypothetical protein [Pseudolabrys sp.]